MKGWRRDYKLMPTPRCAELRALEDYLHGRRRPAVTREMVVDALTRSICREIKRAEADHAAAARDALKEL